MKTLKYTNANKAIDVEYLTDLIGSNKNLTVYQVTQYVNGVKQVNLNATAQSFGMLDKVDMYSLKQMTDQATDKNLTLEVYESGQSKVTLNTLTALAITTTNITGGNSGVAYSLTFEAEGGNEPYVWTTASTLPTGITLSAAGVLSGTTTQTGTFSLTIKVTDKFGVEDTFTDDLVIGA